MEERTVVMPDAPGMSPDATRVMTSPPGAMPYGDATQQAIVVTCPVCGTPNPPAEAYCQDCGLLFNSVSGGVEALPDANDLPRFMDGGGKEYLLNPGVNTVGRESADILLVDATVSRRHAQVTIDDERLMIEDLGSTNGTSVGGVPVKAGVPVPAYTGDAVRFGSISLTVTLPGSGARPAALAAPAPESVDRGPSVGSAVLPDGTEFPLHQGITTVGRRSTNQMVIPDAFASGAHAEVRVESGAVTVVDVGSSNGTFVNGERLAAQTPVTVFDGMSVTFGKTPVSFRLNAEAEPAASDAQPQPDPGALE